jgi:hypothetical protein
MTSMLSDLCVGRGPAGSWPYMLAQGSIWMLVGVWSLQAVLGVGAVCCGAEVEVDRLESHLSPPIGNPLIVL